MNGQWFLPANTRPLGGRPVLRVAGAWLVARTDTTASTEGGGFPMPDTTRYGPIADLFCALSQASSVCIAASRADVPICHPT
jgi:hypothetical protein